MVYLRRGRIHACIVTPRKIRNQEPDRGEVDHAGNDVSQWLTKKGQTQRRTWMVRPLLWSWTSVPKTKNRQQQPFSVPGTRSRIESVIFLGG